MSKGRVFVFDWDEQDAKVHAAEIAAWGWAVETETQDGTRGGSAVKQNPPAAVVFYLGEKASHSRETADYLAQTKATRNIHLIFVGGEGDALEKTRSRVPNGIFVTEASLQAALAKYAK